METAVSAYDTDRFEKALHRYTVAQAMVIEQEDKRAIAEQKHREKQRTKKQ